MSDVLYRAVITTRIPDRAFYGAPILLVEKTEICGPYREARFALRMQKSRQDSFDRQKKSWLQRTHTTPEGKAYDSLWKKGASIETRIEETEVNWHENV